MAEAEGETESLGRRLRALRTELGTTLAQLRRKVGLSASYSSQIERNETKASLATVSSIAKTLVEEFSHFFGHSIAVWHVLGEGPEEVAVRRARVTFELLSSGGGTGKIQPH